MATARSVVIHPLNSGRLRRLESEPLGYSTTILKTCRLQRVSSLPKISFLPSPLNPLSLATPFGRFTLAIQVRRKKNRLSDERSEERASTASIEIKKSLKSLYIWRSLHEFARRESDLPHRFQSPLVLNTQTHRLACHPYSLCLFMLII